MKIKKILAREILDSRGIPTIECSVELENNKIVVSSVPSGASTGMYEALELRDGDKKRYMGKGVLKAVKNLEEKIAPLLIGKIPNLYEMDNLILDLDGTKNKSNLGANAMLAASLGITRAQAMMENLSIHDFIAKIFKPKKQEMPRVMYNILNGGAHADNTLSFQEFMIMPITKTFEQSLEISFLVYYNLKHLLKKEGYYTGIGDEGGFSPNFLKNKKLAELRALDLLVKSVEISGLKPGKDVLFCLDVAASQFYDKKTKTYFVGDKKFNYNEMIDFYKTLLSEYPIFSIEDGLYEEDWDGWKIMTEEIGDNVQLVGDDIFVTNVERIKKGVQLKVANSILIKPNQIGTVTECLNAIKFGCNSNYKIVVSHRSGETLDSFISDLVVGTGSGQFKAGACVRGERVAKYNRLLQIEQNIG